MKNIHKTEIFLRHKDAAELLAKRRRQKVAAVALMFIWFTPALSYFLTLAWGLYLMNAGTPSSEIPFYDIVSSPFPLPIVLMFILMGWSGVVKWLDSYKEHVILNAKVEELALRLELSVEELNADLENTQLLCEKKLIEHAKDVMFLEKDANRLKIECVSTETQTELRHHLDQRIKGRKERFIKLHNFFQEFGLVDPGGYGKYYLQAEKEVK